MRVPVPQNRLVALALLGAVLSSVVAVGLAYPNAASGVTATFGDDAGHTVGATQDVVPVANEPVVSTGGHESFEAEHEDHERGEYEDD